VHLSLKARAPRTLLWIQEQIIVEAAISSGAGKDSRAVPVEPGGRDLGNSCALTVRMVVVVEWRRLVVRGLVQV
jgi:hypothetical protein